MTGWEIIVPEYEIDLKWEWQMHQYIPYGYAHLTLAAKPSGLRWWLASSIAQLAAHVGGGAVTLYGFWADGGEVDVKRAYMSAMKRNERWFVKSMEEDIRLAAADRALDDALAAQQNHRRTA